MSTSNFLFIKTLSFLANWREEFPKYGRPRVKKKSFSVFLTVIFRCRLLFKFFKCVIMVMEKA